MRLLAGWPAAGAGPLAAAFIAAALTSLVPGFGDRTARLSMFAAGIPLIVLVAMLPGLPAGLAVWTALAFFYAVSQFVLWSLRAAWELATGSW